MPKYWFQIALFNFFAASVLGVLMRYAFVAELSWMDYRNIMHGHSHTAMLGWVYMALFGLLVVNFLKAGMYSKRYYSILFWISQAAVTGMLVCFPLYGYKGISIMFSTLHIICSYFFAVRFWKDLRKSDADYWSKNFVKTSLVFMAVSTIAIWGIGPVMVAGMKGSALYYALIQFFLHFQFNGWFIFAILSLFILTLQKREIRFSSDIRPFYIFLLVATALTYVLAVTWSTPIPFLFFINSLGVILQLIALFYFLKWIKFFIRSTIRSLSRLEKFLLIFALSCFILKILAQSVLIIPSVATVAYTIRNFVIGFLHLLLLGTVTAFLFSFVIDLKLINKNHLIKSGIFSLLLGIVATELLLFAQGFMFWQSIGFMPWYHEIIFAFSLLLPIGILLLMLGSFWKGKVLPGLIEAVE